MGGLGLVRLETYLDAQRCSWIVRAAKKNIDNWRYDLKTLAPNGDISRIRISDVNKTRHPLLHNLVRSFSKLAGAHSKINGNYKIAYIFENPAFTWGENSRMLDKPFFGAEFYLRYREKIQKLRLIDCYNGDNFKTIREFSEMGLPLQMNTWLCLRGALKNVKKKNYKKADQLLEMKQEPLLSFMLKQKKGSKKIRKILDNEETEQAQPGSLRIV